MFGPLGPSLAPYINSSRSLQRWVKPIATWYADSMGYRKYGFKYDDLLIEEREDVQRALARLTPAEQYDRGYRIKRASQASVMHAPLPKESWTPENEDTRYLATHVQSVEAEDNERKMWDTMHVTRK